MKDATVVVPQALTGLNTLVVMAGRRPRPWRWSSRWVAAGRQEN